MTVSPLVPLREATMSMTCGEVFNVSRHFAHNFDDDNLMCLNFLHTRETFTMDQNRSMRAGEMIR